MLASLLWLTAPVMAQTEEQSSCLENLGVIADTKLGAVARFGNWQGACTSSNRRRYGVHDAHFYTFVVPQKSTVTIRLSSAPRFPNFTIDTYLYLMSGSGTSQPVLTEDNDGGPYRQSRIRRTLSAGTYTVEATTFVGRNYFSETVDKSFTLSLDVVPEPELVTTTCVESLGAD